MIGSIDPVSERTAHSLLQNTFPEFSDEDVDALSQAASFLYFDSDEDIVREGERGTTLYILAEGKVDIIVHAENDHEILVDSIGPNSYFGEMAFLGQTTRTATIRTCTSCRVLAIDEEDFMPIAGANPDLLRKLLRQIIGHLRRNDQAVIAELNVKNEDLRRAYADLAEQEQLRTQFIATISHELRTPLTAIKGYLGLINQGAIGGNSLQVALDSITRNVAQMVGLTNDLLILYEMHPKSLSFSYLNLADVLIEALNAAREAANGTAADVDVRLNMAPDVPEVYADAQGLTLAIRALIENAFKFNPDRKPVQISADVNGRHEITIAISDAGIGIPEPDQEKIFEPFIRLEQEGSEHLFPGLGVGLTIARFMVTRHNGRITIASTPGQGSTFTIHLPLPTKNGRF